MAIKGFAALLVYCVVFSVCFMILYPLYLDDGRVPESHLTAVGEGRGNKASHVLNAVEQRQVLGLYEDSQSLTSEKESPLAPQPR